MAGDELSRRWMSRVNGKKRLRDITIPGTHDSCALNGIAFWGQCQTLSLKDQLGRGIRALDIRGKLTDRGGPDSIRIFHADIDQQITFGQVVAQCKAFLDENPSEVIVMRFKDEAESSDHGPMQMAVADQTMTINRWWIDPREPVIDEVRGRIVLLSEIGDQIYRDRKTLVWGSGADIQDAYNVPTLFDIEGKWRLVEQQLLKARGRMADVWYFNFASGAGPLAGPAAVADRINPRLYDWLGQPQYIAGNYGVIYLDFPEHPEPPKNLVERIFMTNFPAGE